MRKLALTIFLVCMAAGQAKAGVTATTLYKPFPVHGKSAREIYRSVLAHSRKKDGFNTFATTEVSLKPHVVLMSKPRCQITSASITARFVVHLPQLRDEAALAPALRADWRAFALDLKKHEEHHRDIWLGCAADLAAAATGTPAADCKSFARQFERRIKAQQKACQARNAAFDDAAQGQLPGLPFIRRALAGH